LQTFAFQLPVMTSSHYQVSVYQAAPLGQSCAFNGGAPQGSVGGQIVDADITNLQVTCTIVPYLYSFETGFEDFFLGSWQKVPVDLSQLWTDRTGEAMQVPDFHTQGVSGLRINAGPGAEWFGSAYQAPVDLSGTTHLKWDVQTVNTPTTQELAIQTGDGWAWCQGGGWQWLDAGTTTTMDVDLTNLDCNADLSQVHALYIYFGNGSTGTYCIDNIRAE
jgi:mannan endo-1,4-beta-mannosidase